MTINCHYLIKVKLKLTLFCYKNSAGSRYMLIDVI